MTGQKLWVKLTKIEKKLDELLSKKDKDESSSIAKIEQKLNQLTLEVKRVNKKIK